MKWPRSWMFETIVWVCLMCIVSCKDDAKSSADVFVPDGDGDPDGGEPACQWGPFGTPQQVSVDLTDFTHAGGATVTGDALTLYVHARYPDEESQIMRATRGDASEPFGALAPVVALQSDVAAFDPSISEDGNTIYFSRWDNDAPSEIYMAEKDGADFGAPIKVSNVNDLAWDSGPFATSDGLWLFFDSRRAGTPDLYAAKRNSPDAEFDPPVALAKLNTANHEARPTVSEDVLEIFFTQAVSGEDSNIMTATKVDLDAPYGTPVPVAEVNTDIHEGQPFLARDGRTLYFTRSEIGSDQPTLWYVTRACE